MDEILAKQAITEVLYRYCRAMDRMDRALALACFHDGAGVDLGDAYSGPATGFVEWVWSTHRGFHGHSHQITNVLIDVDGDRAASEAYLTVALRAGTAPDDLFDFVGRGRYLDRWSRRDSVWAIDERVLVTDFRGIYPVRDLASGDTARRDRGDPSYGFLRDVGPGSALGRRETRRQSNEPVRP